MLMLQDHLLFRVLVTHRAEQDFHDRYDQRRLKAASELHVDPDQDGWFPLWYAQEHPAAFPYNDLYGFFEVFWDGGTRVLADAYFRGDGRRRAGRRLKRMHGGGQLKASGFYWYMHRHDLSWIPREASSTVIREALAKALTAVDEAAAELGGVASTGECQLLLDHVDWAAVLVTRPA